MIEIQHPDVNVVAIHRFPQLLNQTVELINSQWPRSQMARLVTLQSSSDALPTCFVATRNDNKVVIGHAKLTPVPADAASCFVESVVVSPSMRGQGIGSFLMQRVETHCRDVLQLKQIYLSTYDKESFYFRLGYEVCQPISIFGTRSFVRNSSTKKTYMKKCL